MKTVKDMLNLLEPEIKERSLIEAEKQNILDLTVHTISDAIMNICWTETGDFDFWSNLHIKYYNLETKGLEKNNRLTYITA